MILAETSIKCAKHAYKYIQTRMAESDHKSWAGRTALITGAASGNGKGTAKVLAKHGMIVIGCDIDLDNLKVSKMAIVE